MVKNNLAFSVGAEDDKSIEIAGAPVKYCTVALSDVIARGKRLEASVFDVEAKQAREAVEHGKYPILTIGGDKGLIKSAFYPGRFKRIYCDFGVGEPFYLPSQMTDVYPKAGKHISALTKCDIGQLKLKPKTLLLTRSGTIGSVSPVSKTLEGMVFSDDVIRVSFKDDIDLGYVYTFLRSKVGNTILTTNGYGAVITHIEPEHLATVPIPDAPVSIKQRINDLIVRSYELRDESNTLIDEATDLLIKELHLPAIQSFDVDLFKKGASVDTFSVKLSKLSGRADASYHVPIVDAIIEHLKKHAAEVTTVGDSRISKEVILPGRFKRVYVENGYGVPFFGGRSIGELDPSDKKYLSFSQHDAKIKKELTIHECMILVTCSGTIGNVALVPRHWDNWAMTHDIIRLIPNSNIEGYVYIWLQSEYAKQLIRAFTYGSVVPHIEKDHICQTVIPLLKDQSVQQKINELALSANEKRYEAYQLEQQALSIMDKEVIFA